MQVLNGSSVLCASKRECFFHFKSVDHSCTTLILFQLGVVYKNLGEEMVPVMMEIITLIVILMMETVVDLVSIENFAQIVYVYLKIHLLQVIKSFLEVAFILINLKNFKLLGRVCSDLFQILFNKRMQQMKLVRNPSVM